VINLGVNNEQPSWEKVIINPWGKSKFGSSIPQEDSFYPR